jgi:hypothetical protein
MLSPLLMEKMPEVFPKVNWHMVPGGSDALLSRLHSAFATLCSATILAFFSLSDPDPNWCPSAKIVRSRDGNTYG